MNKWSINAIFSNDGLTISFSLNESGTNFLIHIEYEHSYHEIKIKLEIKSIEPTISWIYILPLTLIFIVLMSLFQFHFHKKT